MIRFRIQCSIMEVLCQESSILTPAVSFSNSGNQPTFTTAVLWNSTRKVPLILILLFYFNLFYFALFYLPYLCRHILRMTSESKTVFCSFSLIGRFFVIWVSFLKNLVFRMIHSVSISYFEIKFEPFHWFYCRKFLFVDGRRRRQIWFISNERPTPRQPPRKDTPHSTPQKHLQCIPIFFELKINLNYNEVEKSAYLSGLEYFIYFSEFHKRTGLKNSLENISLLFFSKLKDFQN